MSYHMSLFLIIMPYSAIRSVKSHVENSIMFNADHAAHVGGSTMFTQPNNEDPPTLIEVWTSQYII